MGTKKKLNAPETIERAVITGDVTGVTQRKHYQDSWPDFTYYSTVVNYLLKDFCNFRYLRGRLRIIGRASGLWPDWRPTDK